MIDEPSTPPPPATNDLSTLLITSRPEAIKVARDFTREWFGGRGYGSDAVHIALLVVSELVTNAYKHGSAPGDAISVRLYLSAEGPVAEVRDGSELEPVVKPFRLDTFSGRGLAIVSELAAGLGFRHLASGGKAVYAVLRESV